MSNRVASGIHTRAKGESFILDTTRTRMLQMACETLQSYRSICKVIFRIHFIEGKKIKVKVYVMKRVSLSHIQTSSC